MTILLNGAPHALEARLNLLELLARLGYTEGFAVALNRDFVPRSLYADTWVAPGDEVEVLTPRQGG